MSDLLRPMLAAEGVLGQISWPKLVSAKLNGVRGFNPHGALLSRTLKPIPNPFTREKYSHEMFRGFDGELVVGDFYDEQVFTNSTSGVMRGYGEPDVKWYVFDLVDEVLTFSRRCEELAKRVAALDPAHGVILVPHRLIKSDEELVKFHDECVGLGYEGVVIRSPLANYKMGRSTAREQGFMRFVLWHRSEVEILGVIEGMTNQNEAKTNELGRTARSTNKENMRPTGVAGAVEVCDIHTGMEFKISLGDDAQCADFWNRKEHYIGKVYTYKFRTPVNPGGKPRFPILEGERHEEDMS